MAFQQSNISALTDIPALVYSFAGTAGWTVGGTTTVPILTRPGGGLPFTLTASTSTFDNTLTWTNGGNSARVVSPKLNGTTSTPVVGVPSKVYLFGDATFIAIVVEYGFNSYRHLYLGNMVKAGSYTGGEVISGATPLTSIQGFEYPMSYRSAAYLFAGRQVIHPSAAASGGVNVTHANNPTAWRRFRSTTHFQPYQNFDNASAIGGFCDDVNDGYVARGRSAYAGAQILVPVNLYASMPITADTLFVPLGCPAGVRMVNMADIDPAGTFVIGSQTWQCFPAFRKSASTTVAKSASGWAADETSYMVGYAYPRS